MFSALGRPKGAGAEDGDEEGEGAEARVEDGDEAGAGSEARAAAGVGWG